MYRFGNLVRLIIGSGCYFGFYGFLKFVIQKIQLFKFFFQNRIPFFTLPFTLPTMVFINVNDTRGLLHRVENFSYPEKQAWEWHKAQKVRLQLSIDLNLHIQ